MKFNPEAVMATELEIKAKLDTLRSLPPRLEKLSNSLGTVNWPGQATRLNFPLGMELTEEEREQSTSLLKEIRAVIEGTNLDSIASSKAKLSLVTKMAMGSPMAANSTEEQSSARRDLYLDALDDVPPWSIAKAIKRWNKGECEGIGLGVMNYNFPPSPAVLRKLCKLELSPLEVQVAKLKRILAAVPIERAMDPAPMKAEVLRIDGQRGQ